MKINRSNRLLRGLLIAAAVPSLAFAVDVTNTGTIINTGNVTNTGNVANTGTLTNTGDALVNGTLTVQPVATPPGLPVNNNTGAGALNPGDLTPPVAPPAGSTTVATKLGETTGTYTALGQTGVVLETNGDVTLNSGAGQEIGVTYSRLTTVDIYNADQPLAGQPVLGSQKYYAAKPDPANPGQFIPISGPFIDEAALQTWITNTPLDDAAFADVSTVVDIPGAGGNLQVGGNANVDGTLSVGEVPDVEAALGDLADADVVLQENIDEVADDLAIETQDRIDADVVLQENIDAEATTRANEDISIRNDFAAADTTLQNNIDAEATTRANEDISIRSEFRTADTALSTRINNEAYTRAAEDTSIRNEFRAADDQINSRVDSLASDVKSNRYQIDRNTRGIAMVAAMTNSTVLPGKTQVLDFNLAQFDDATGFAFGYGYRVNENLQINAAGASTTDFDEAVARLGISYQW